MNDNGVMIAFFIPPDVSEKLYTYLGKQIGEYIQPIENTHCTILYLGKTSDITVEQQDKLALELGKYATNLAPLKASINGIARFVDHNPNALVANFDAPGLASLRAICIHECRLLGIEPNLDHGYTPHVTLAYLPKEIPTPEIKLDAIEVLLNTLTLAVGDRRFTYTLNGATVVSEMEQEMPYAIEKKKDKYLVVNKDTRRVLGKHDTQAEADAQLKAVYANTVSELEKIIIVVDGDDDAAEDLSTIDDTDSIGDSKDSEPVDTAEGNEDEIGELFDSDHEDYLATNRIYGDIGWQILAETVPENASPEDFAYPPKGLYIGDKVHAHEAAVAIGNGSYRGNKLDIPESAIASVKSKVVGAVRKYYTGGTQKYLLTWIKTGKKPEKAPEAVRETKRTFSEFAPSFEFKGKPPDVPFSPAVNVFELTNGDPNPLYIIRPLAVIGGVSENNLEYDKALVNSIREQVIAKRPPARLGHLSEEEASSKFPLEVGLWVGATLVDNTLWGKCYTYPADGIFREMIRKRKAAGSGISNSIYGKGKFGENADGTQNCSDLDLESIDFAPPERAALQALGRELETTAEMTNNKIREVTEMAETQQGNDVTPVDFEVLKKHLAEMEAKDVYSALPEGHKHKIAEFRLKEMDNPSVYEMLSDEHRKYVKESMKDKVEETKVLAEMSGRVSELERENRDMKERIYDGLVNDEINSRFATWSVNGDENKHRLADIKSLVKETFAITIGKDRSDIKGGVDRAWESKRTIIEMAKASFAGPAAFAAPAEQLERHVEFDKWDRTLATPEKAKEARQSFGF